MYPILESKPYGATLYLTCNKHPKLRWLTKNISPMGCRNIFFRGEVQEDGSTRFARECDCPRSELIVVEGQ